MTESEETNVIWPQYPQMTRDNAAKLLREAKIPVWHLALDTTLTAANPLLLWLWGMIKLPGKVFRIQPLLNKSAFDIFRENLVRITTQSNRDFLTKKSAIAKRIMLTSGEHIPSACLAFRKAMYANPELQEIFDQAENPGNEWEYTLRMRHPENDNSLEL